MKKNTLGFTLVEIIVVIFVLGIFITALFISTQPYMKRSRDTKRASDIQNYITILEGYEKNFDTFPSNYGSGGSAVTVGYCLSEVATRSNIGTIQDKQFDSLRNSTVLPPVDPANLTTSPCSLTKSYLYSRMNYGSSGNQVIIIAASLEMRPSGNYGTGTDLYQSPNPDLIVGSQARIDKIVQTKKSTIPDTAPDQLFIVSALR